MAQTQNVDPARLLQALRSTHGDSLPWEHPDVLKILKRAIGDRGAWLQAAQTLLGIDTHTLPKSLVRDIVTRICSTKTEPHVLETCLRAYVVILESWDPLNEVAFAVARTAHRVATSPELATLMCEALSPLEASNNAPIIDALVTLMLRHSNVKAVVHAAMESLAYISGPSRKMTQLLIRSGAVIATLNVLDEYIDDVDIVENCVQVFSSLELDDPCCLESLAAVNFFTLIEKALLLHADDGGVVYFALKCLHLKFACLKVPPTVGDVAAMATVLLKEESRPYILVPCMVLRLAASAHVDSLVSRGVVGAVVNLVLECVGDDELKRELAGIIVAVSKDRPRGLGALADAGAMTALVHALRAAAADRTCASHVPDLTRALARLVKANPMAAVKRGALATAVALISRHGKRCPAVAKQACKILEALSATAALRGLVRDCGGDAAVRAVRGPAWPPVASATAQTSA